MKRPLEQAFSIPNVMAGLQGKGFIHLIRMLVAKHSRSLLPCMNHFPQQVIQNLLVCILLQFRNLPLSLSQSPSQLYKQTTQTIVPPAQPPLHTVYGTSGALHAEDAVTVVSSGTESVCSQSDTVTTSTKISFSLPFKCCLCTSSIFKHVLSNNEPACYGGIGT